jgi:hypothetical protein
MENAKTVSEKIVCHDCGKEIQIKDEQLVKGKMLVYDHNGQKIKVAKCNLCYKKNKKLTNFQNCEVYSRIVGYLRPVNQWNDGKKVEYNMRKEYKNSCDCGC